MIKKFLLALLLKIPLSYIFSTVYYVAVNGKDANSGTLTKPFATLQKAQEKVNAGDTVYIRGGVYLLNDGQIALKERRRHCLLHPVKWMAVYLTLIL